MSPVENYLDRRYYRNWLLWTCINILVNSTKLA